MAGVAFEELVRELRHKAAGISGARAPSPAGRATSAGFSALPGEPWVRPFGRRNSSDFAHRCSFGYLSAQGIAVHVPAAQGQDGQVSAYKAVVLRSFVAASASVGGAPVTAESAARAQLIDADVSSEGERGEGCD